MSIRQVLRYSAECSIFGGMLPNHYQQGLQKSLTKYNFILNECCVITRQIFIIPTKTSIWKDE